MQTEHNCLLRGQSYLKPLLAVMQNFQLLNGCCGNRACYGVNLNDTIRLHDPKNRRVGKQSAQLSFTGTELYRFEVLIGRNANFKKILRTGAEKR